MKASQLPFILLCFLGFVNNLACAPTGDPEVTITPPPKPQTPSPKREPQKSEENNEAKAAPEKKENAPSEKDKEKEKFTVPPLFPKEQKDPLRPQAEKETKKETPETKTPAPPVETPPRTWEVNQSQVGQLFNLYLDRTPATDMRNIESMASRLVAEIFNEDNRIAEKIREIQGIIKKRAEAHRYTEGQSEKVHLLEAGLAQAAMRRDVYSLAEDSAIILSSAIAFAVLRGYSLDRQLVQKGRAALSDLTGSSQRSVHRTPRSAESYQEAGQRIEGFFARIFRKVSPEEQIHRDLETLGLSQLDRRTIEKSLIKASEGEAERYKNLRYYHFSGIRSFDIAAYKVSEPTTEQFGGLVFRVGSGLAGRKRQYFVTNPMNEPQVRRLVGQMTEHSKNSQPLRTAAGGAAIPRFDVSRGAQTFLYSASLMSAGYAYSLSQNFEHRPVYLESVLEGPEIPKNAPVQQIPHNATYEEVIQALR